MINTVTFTLNLDESNPKAVESVIRMLNGLNGTATKADTEQVEAAKPQKEKAAKKTKVLKNNEPEMDQKPDTSPDPSPVSEPKKETSVHTISEVRSLLAKKVQNHREEVKNKLTELGSNNVTSLSVDLYDEFVSFLNGLK